MKNKQIETIINTSKERGWILEPEAQEILNIYKIGSKSLRWLKSEDEVINSKILYPCAAKVVSPKILHKSEHNGVQLNIKDKDDLHSTYKKLSQLPYFKGIIVDTMTTGVELIIGSKNDQQFGTVIIVGIGGTTVEVYEDISIIMAPAKEKDIIKAIERLKGIKLLKGFRGIEDVNLETLCLFIQKFSEMTYHLKDSIESIDLNPVICHGKNIHVADARMIIKQSGV